MVTKIVPIQRIDDRNQRETMAGDKKRTQYGASFKEVFTRELENTLKVSGLDARAQRIVFFPKR
ncbi:hypothetical protein [Sporomusa sp.]|uniref:hypothetical protein n=1 Tax=Sporomusa sp. TaxID=2078658 RepID=UPI002BE252BC|nr:hypothetical protein [Sporomusa sp.]HWR09379.1 hypothetical protein [Sporomusa sp.]